jgi:hypothetical protein
MDAITNALALPSEAPQQAVQQAPAFTRPAIDWSLYWGLDQVPGWAYEEGITGFNHFGTQGQYNELSPYVKATRDMDNGLSMGLGRTINSEGADSIFAGIGGDYGPAWWEVGGATGYEAAPVIPFGRVGIDLTDNLSAWAMPAYEQGNLGAVLGMNFRPVRW